MFSFRLPFNHRFYPGTQKRATTASDQQSSSNLIAIQRLADYCKQFSVTADIVMETDEQQIRTRSDRQYEEH